MSNENKAELHELDEDELHELDMVASQRDFFAPISYWAHIFALEFARLNGGRVSVSIAFHPFEQTFTKAAIDGTLTVRDKVAMLPVTVNDKTHPNFLFNEALVAKDDLRAWVEEYRPELRSRLLGFDIHAEQPEPVLALKTTSAEMLNKIQADIRAKQDYHANKRPAPLFGEGFSEEMRMITTLTKYLELETWTPIEAAMLVCGLQPTADGLEIPKGAMGLENALVMPYEDRFHDAKRVLKVWNSQENPVTKIRPAKFVEWCWSKGINTDWLRDIEATAAQPKIAQEDKTPIEREHELHDLITRVFTKLERPKSNSAVWDVLAEPENDPDEIIQEIFNDRLDWISRRGVEQTMTRKTFDNILSKLRKS